MLHDKFICSLFLQGRCFECGPDNERCALMGYRAVEYFPRIQLEKRQNVKFYFDTARVAPFCRKFIHIIHLFCRIWLRAEIFSEFQKDFFKPFTTHSFLASSKRNLPNSQIQSKPVLELCLPDDGLSNRPYHFYPLLLLFVSPFLTSS